MLNSWNILFGFRFLSNFFFDFFSEVSYYFLIYNQLKKYSTPQNTEPMQVRT